MQALTTEQIRALIARGKMKDTIFQALGIICLAIGLLEEDGLMILIGFLLLLLSLVFFAAIAFFGVEAFGAIHHWIAAHFGAAPAVTPASP